MKIKALNEKVRNMKLQVPYDGLISIDSDGVAVVSDKAAKLLVNGTSDWKYAEDKKTSKENKKTSEQVAKEPETSETTEEAEVADEPETETEEQEEVDESKMIIEGIKKMSLEEMLATAKDAGYSEDEYKKFAKKEKMMAAYLIKKYNESQKEAE